MAKVRKAGGDYYEIPRGRRRSRAARGEESAENSPSSSTRTSARPRARRVCSSLARVRVPERRRQARRVRPLRHGGSLVAGTRRRAGPGGAEAVRRRGAARPERNIQHVLRRGVRGRARGALSPRERAQQGANGARAPPRESRVRGEGPHGGAPRARGGGGGGGDGRGDDPADVLRNLFQLLPLMLVFLMYFLAPGAEEHDRLHRSPQFRHEMRGRRLDQTPPPAEPRAVRGPPFRRTRGTGGGSAERGDEPRERAREQLPVRAAAAAR